MTIKIIKQPPTQFTMKCERCECVFTYALGDVYKSLTGDNVDCPYCKDRIPHSKRERSEGNNEA